MRHSGIEIVHQGQIVKQYREALKWSQQDLADALQVSLRTVQRMEQMQVIKKRRELLIQLLGIPAALIVLENNKLQQSKKTSLVVNDDRMAYLENNMILRFQAQQVGGTRSSSHGLDLWMNEVTSFVKTAEGTGWHTRALSILSMSYLLQGTIARSMKLDYTKAHTAFQEAYHIAQELDDPELMALALFREGVAFINEEKPREAITYLKGAHDTITGHGYPYLRGHILKLLSEAYAKAQQQQECWRCVGLAEGILSQLTGQPERSMFIQREFSLASVTAQRGVDAAFLHDYDRAIRLIDKGLIGVSPALIPTRARLTIQKAEAYYGLGEMANCVTHAEEAFTLALSVGSNKTIARVENLYTALKQSKWNKEPDVRRLGALLATK